MDPKSVGVLVVMTAVLLIPVLPAILLYKVLPEGKVQFRGRIFGLQVNAAGAFSAYFLVALFAFRIQQKVAADASSSDPFETWTINAVVKVADERDDVAGALATLDPPLTSVNPRNRTTAQIQITAPIMKGAMPSQLMVKKGALLPAMVPVDLDPTPDSLTGLTYRVKRDPRRRVLTIMDTLFLRRMEEYRPTAPPFRPTMVPGAVTGLPKSP